MMHRLAPLLSLFLLWLSAAHAQAPAELKVLQPRAITENTLRRGFAPDVDVEVHSPS